MAITSDQWVIIPFAERIRFSSSENRRNPGMLLDIVRSHAVLMQHQREHEEHNGISCIVATIEDFKAACQLYQKLNGEDGGQMSKLTRAESELIIALRDSYQTEIKIFDMPEYDWEIILFNSEDAARVHEPWQSLLRTS